MKWPLYLAMIRHGQSEYNVLKKMKFKDPKYKKFITLYEEWVKLTDAREKMNGFDFVKLMDLADYVQETFALPYGDHDTPMTKLGHEQSVATGKRLPELLGERPDVVVYSPYLRTQQTGEGLVKGWPDLANAKWVEDDRVREQEHGLSILYNDWRVFHLRHPEQRLLRNKQGPFWYTYPQGESPARARDRIRSMINTTTREHSGQRVFWITHHLTILCGRSILERLTPDEFIRLDHEEKPVNCGVTKYQGNPTVGKKGKLELEVYNQQLW